MSSRTNPRRTSRPRRWYAPIKSALRISLYIACHTFVAALIIGANESIAYLIKRLGDPKLFDVVPLRFCFDAVDACILLVFFVFGVAAAVINFKE